MNKSKFSFRTILIAAGVLPCALLLMPFQAFSAITYRNSNSPNYANAYNQVVAMQQQAEYYNQQQANAAENLPVHVANQDLADKISRGDKSADIDMSNLESCAAIYPNGEFAWDNPNAGIKAGASPTCVAVVEMRRMRDGDTRKIEGEGDIVLARVTIAAGDSIECNISKFPESSLTMEAGNVIFPADKEPTVEDVVKVMDSEQKKNAGLKIAAGAVIGGLFGNIGGKNKIGESNLMGTGKEKMQSAAVGALSGAALMAGSSYAGKVGGDVIMSAGVNAAAGAVAGNVVASGESVLRIEDCTDLSGIQTTCLWGRLEKGEELDTNKKTAFYDTGTQNTIVCENEGEINKECITQRLINIKFADGKSLDDAISDSTIFKNNEPRFHYNQEQRTVENAANGELIKIESAQKSNEVVSAMITNIKDKSFGLKMKDWNQMRKSINSNQLIGRTSNGESVKLADAQGWEVGNFHPLTMEAGDGGIIDFSNKARTKGTLIGAGAGAGLGAFTAYQGAQDEIDARWVSAVQEYKDSLQKIYCGTGTRFLSYYNEISIIPNMQ
jgi:hypothetical protein